MFGSLSEEVEVKVPAEKAWDLYGTIKIGDIAAKHILESLDVIEGDGGVGTIIKLTFKPGKNVWIIHSFNYFHSLCRISFWKPCLYIPPPYTPSVAGLSIVCCCIFLYILSNSSTIPRIRSFIYKERYTMIDNEKMVKEAEMIEGGYLDFGFTLYRVRIEVKDNPNDETGFSCFVKTTIEYEVKEEAAENASLVTIEPFVVLMKFANEHLLSSS